MLVSHGLRPATLGPGCLAYPPDSLREPSGETKGRKTQVRGGGSTGLAGVLCCGLDLAGCALGWGCCVGAGAPGCGTNQGVGEGGMG